MANSLKITFWQTILDTLDRVNSKDAWAGRVFHENCCLGLIIYRISAQNVVILEGICNTPDLLTAREAFCVKSRKAVKGCPLSSDIQKDD
jgi:hypothetical protein